MEINEVNSWAVFGERGSGTRWTSSIIQKNSVRCYNISDTLFTGWKHGLWTPKQNRFLNKNTAVVVIQKNIFAWLVSLKRNPWHMHHTKEKSLSEFIRGECFSTCNDTKLKKWHQLNSKDEMPERPDGLRWENPIRMWVDKYHAWENIPMDSSPLVYAKYEDLLQDPNSLVELLSSVGILMGPKNTNSNYKNAEYYNQEHYMNFFNPSDIDFVQEQLLIPPRLFFPTTF